MKARVWHKRHTPVINQFSYPAFYLVCPITGMDELNRGWAMGHNRAAPVSLHDRDYGARGLMDHQHWVQRTLDQAGVTPVDGPIVLVAMPRLFGFVFNPVCFWLCCDEHSALRAVICEVNNTFGETHLYVCARDDGQPWTCADEVFAPKKFHVSPFFERRGEYRFRFDVQSRFFAVQIDYLDDNSDPRLQTSLAGPLAPVAQSSLASGLWHAPLIAIAAVLQILWQAAKLKLKGLAWIHKPTILQPARTSAGIYQSPTDIKDKSPHV